MKQDSSWRRILDKLLPDFLAFYFHRIYEAIDFSKGFAFLDKELQQILPQADDTGDRRVDKLVKVFLRDGSEKWLLIHIEVQGYREVNFARRVYQCNYRISDKFEEDVISVALLTDENLEFGEHIHEISFCGFRLYFEFPMVKLLKYQENWDELERDPNPFAIATMAFLKTVETKGHEYERYQWKKYFLLELYRRGMSRETILALYDFIGVIMALPLAKDEQLYEEIKPTMEEKQMSVLAIAERVGLKNGLTGAISDILEIKFGIAGLELLKPVEQITAIETLEKIRAGLKQAKSVAEAEALIRAHANGQAQVA